jgi:hypothetical protein
MKTWVICARCRTCPELMEASEVSAFVERNDWFRSDEDFLCSRCVGEPTVVEIAMKFPDGDLTTLSNLLNILNSCLKSSVTNPTLPNKNSTWTEDRQGKVNIVINAKQFATTDV